MQTTPENRIKHLADQIMLYRDNYYNKDLKKTFEGEVIPISDDQFDALYDELETLDPENPALTEIGAEPNSEWPKVKHTFNAGSLLKVKTPEELVKWINEHFTEKHSIFWSEKIDGLTILLTYEKGELKMAASRGGGDIGENLTPNVIKMQGVKTKLTEPFTGVIRGEILLRKSSFKKNGFAELGYANERNAASGIARRIDGKGCEFLDVLCYQMVGEEKLNSEYIQFQQILHLGLQTPAFGSKVGTNEEKAKYIIDTWKIYQDKERDLLDYAIDGLVIRMNDLENQLALGFKHNRPVGARAFKFRSYAATSIVKKIICQVGSSGRITPVIEIEPVQIGGVEVKRASLYNFGYIRDMQLDIGATVRVIRSGDVIPVCEAVLKGTGTAFIAPSVCPACGGQVGSQGEHLMCLNSIACPAQVEGRLMNWIKGLDIKEFGEKLVSKLVETGMAITIPELYSLSVDDLASIERMGKKSAEKCIDNLWDKTEIDLETFFGSLSIPLIGTSTIKLLIDAGYDTVDTILNITEAQLQVIKGLGPERIRSLLTGLAANEQVINALLLKGIITMKREKTVAKTSATNNGKLAGMNICITGKTNMKREDLAVMIGENGGRWDKSIAKDTGFLVVADPSKNSLKMQKAQKAGVKVISEDALLELIGEI